MIAHLRGKLLAKHPNQAIVETAGVGYDVTISVPTFSDLPAVGGDIALHIHTHVREDVIALYGFLRRSEKLLFEKLITVSGIGPKLAITILSGMAADEMAGAIRGNDVARLTRIPGIGKKTAERMVLELRDKLDAFSVSAEVTAAAAKSDIDPFVNGRVYAFRVLAPPWPRTFLRRVGSRSRAVRGGRASRDDGPRRVCHAR